MEYIDQLAVQIGGYFWNIVLALGVFLGIYYGIRLRFVQIRMFPETMRLIKEQVTSKEKIGGVSGIQAFLVTLGGAIGTGSVGGVAMALIAGGPGVVVWLWVICILGGATSFVEHTLGQIYKTKEGDIFRGGPSYYMEKALGQRWMGIFYAFIMIVSLGFALVGLQTNSIVEAVNGAVKVPRFAIALVIAVLIALIIFGGIKRIAEVAEKGVPVMAAIYILMLIVVMICRWQEVPSALALIFREAFSARAVTGAGFTTIVIQGFKRGVFSSGQGHGDAPTTNASATVTHPIKQGLLGSTAIYTVCVMCTVTALVIVLSGVYTGTDLVGMALSQYAFVSVLGNWAAIIFALCMAMFCFTSIMANYYCGETCLTYLSHTMRGRNLYRIIFVAVVFLGGIAEVQLMWDIADVLLAVMIITNMVALLLLGRQVVVTLNDYVRQKSEGKNPVFHAKDAGIENAECWE